MILLRSCSHCGGLRWPGPSVAVPLRPLACGCLLYLSVAQCWFAALVRASFTEPDRLVLQTAQSRAVAMASRFPGLVCVVCRTAFGACVDAGVANIITVEICILQLSNYVVSHYVQYVLV